ncbi:glycosyltransferase family 1 protein [Chamaesiphon sp. OTE_8_metabat_110]|uniref:glycosyltransferase family 4 protein n=1 Tax=Chamaesiphon sp. OTE_8_metabat_110 TaxID=2964696 RepID=UPI00286A83A7|nr:glycosyltransferase family 1 protein [Chamaesiphon sp. OTE_8_metabat_110]
MRVFLDCTHTAKNSYKNTGIHRVVRELTSESIAICAEYLDLDIIPVMFDGYGMRRVFNFGDDIYGESIAKICLFDSTAKNISKFSIFLLKLKNKVINNINAFKSKIYPLDIEFENIRFSQNDIYIIADANWDLPESYYHFLQNLKAHQVTIGVICYDLIPTKFPEYCSKKFVDRFVNFYSHYSPLFDKVLCISKQSAADYTHAQAIGILPNNSSSIVSSFRLGSNFTSKELIRDGNSNDDRYPIDIISSRYVLVVGSLTPHKNIKTILAAFNLLTDENYQDVHLILAGNKGWDVETDRAIETNEMYQKRVHVLGSISDYQLDVLYRNCYCLIQASFYEGFGLPVVEALQHGKPVISSTGGSLPEVGGDFCIYFDPNQPIELYEALQKILTSDLEYDCLTAHIRSKYKIFSWNDSAKQFLDCLLKIP